jgi:hypothetical protein
MIHACQNSSHDSVFGSATASHRWENMIYISKREYLKAGVANLQNIQS